LALHNLAQMLSISVQKKLHFAFGKKNLQIELNVPNGQLLAILGDSGSGKTTLLRLLAGLTQPDSGQIVFENQPWVNTEKHILVPPQQRSIGFVFQDYALFPNMTVEQNLRFALPKNQSTAIITELLHITELTALAHRRPTTLSGGQQQRAALARALVRQPRLLLLDEPLSALDAGLRSRLQQFIREVHQRFELTTVLVSHDREEIVKLADAVIRLERGEVVERTTPSTYFQLQNMDNGKLLGEVLQLKTQQGREQAEILIGENVLTVATGGQKLQPGMKVQIQLSTDGHWEIIDD